MFWFAVRTAPNCEASVNGKLKAKGIRTFYPRNRCRTISQRRTDRHKVRWKERPHFPTYLFIRAEPASLSLVRDAGAQVVMFAGKPTPISYKVMQVLMAGADESGLIKWSAENVARARFAAMHRIAFTSGPFTNTLAQVILDEGGDTIRVLMQVLGARREVSVPVNQIAAA